MSKRLLAFVLPLLLISAAAWAKASGTNIVVESSASDLFREVQREEEESFGWQMDPSTRLGINDDGDPYVGARF
jgi:hypothetical protein